MRAINNFENVQASTGEFAKPGAGGYCVEILSVKDVPFDPIKNKGDYLVIDYDICHGDFKGHYTKQHERYGGNWFASFIRSYKESAAGMFKHFINCIEESNSGYKWNWNEQSLVHKYVGIVLGEEEYLKNDGTVGTKLVVKDVKTIQQIAKGDFKVPEIKRLSATPTATASTNLPPITGTDDLPFN